MINVNEMKTRIARLLDDYPELIEDSDLLHDTLEGSTDLMEVVRELLTQHEEDTMLAMGIKERKKQLDLRKGRIERRIEAVRETMAELLRLLPEGERTLRLSEATISYRKAGAGSAIVNDLEALPQGFYRMKKEARLDEIGRALRAGEQVPGAELVPGKDGVTIRNT